MRYLQQVSCSGTICDVELLKMLLEEHHSQICMYIWRASLQELSSFHKDILIVLGVWYFFFQIQLMTPDLPMLLLVRSLIGVLLKPKYLLREVAGYQRR